MINVTAQKLGSKVKIWFACTVESKRERADGLRPFLLRLHGRGTLITLDGVPSEELRGGLPSPRVLWQAETIFLTRQAHFYPDHDVVEWEAHLNDSNGPVLSTFRVLLPS